MTSPDVVGLRREIVDLTICRALFAAWVFAYHVDLHAHFSGAAPVMHGYLGVDGFFILSGLILACAHPELASSPRAAGRFWVRRLARIYPVHLAVILLLCAVVGIGFTLGLTPRDPGRFTLPSLVENLLLIHGWGFTSELAWNYPSWSISTEWAGYLLFPALWFGIARLPGGLAAGLLALCLPVLGIVDLRCHGLNLTFAWSLLRFFPEFIAGIATARLLSVLARPMLPETLAGLGVLTILAALLLAPDVCVVVGLWAVLTGLAARAAGAKPGLLPLASPLRFLGQLSYAFYMSFGTVELFLAQLGRHRAWDPAAHKLVYAGSMTGLTFLLALSLHNLVEKPARAWIDRRFAGGKAPVAFERNRLKL